MPDFSVKYNKHERIHRRVASHIPIKRIHSLKARATLFDIYPGYPRNVGAGYRNYCNLVWVSEKFVFFKNPENTGMRL